MIIPNFLRPKIDEVFFRSKTERLILRMKQFFSRGDKILDLGSGIGMFSHILQEQGYQVTPIDVKDKSLYPSVRPLIYDGKKLPFADYSFDVCLLLSVLHHTQNPEAILKEAKRVANKIIVSENIYRSATQKLYTHFIDSLLNLEFFHHPHTNRTDKQWKEAFKRLGLTLIYSEYYRTFKWISNTIYYVKS